MNNILSPLKRLPLSFWLPAAWIIFVAACAVTAGIWPLPEPDYMDWENPAAPPGSRGVITTADSDGREVEITYVYRLGTDTMGRDIVTRILFGARVSLSVGIISPVIGLLIGGFLGALAGFYRGRLESIIVGVMDTILAFPGLVLLLAITFYLGPSLQNLTLALGFFTIPAFSRVARAQTLKFADREFVQASRMMGENDAGILIREITPNILIPLLIYSLLVVAFMIVVEGALSFLGFGVPPPTPSWGGMIAEGKEVLDETPHIAMVPAFIMFLTVLSFNLIGDALRSLIDPGGSQI